MIVRRIAAFRTVALEVQRCSAALAALDAKASKPAVLSRSNNQFHTNRANEDDVANIQERRRNLHGVRAKLLFRKVPIAISRLERCLVVPKSQRVVQPAKVDVSSQLVVSSPRGELIDPEAAIVSPSRMHNLVSELGLQTARGPMWDVSTHVEDTDQPTSSPSISPEAANQFLRLLLLVEHVRADFVTKEQAALQKTIRGLQRDIAGRSDALRRKRLSVQQDESLRSLRDRATVEHRALEALTSSVVMKPYISSFLWKALLQPTFISVAFPGLHVAPFFNDGQQGVLSPTQTSSSSLQSAVAMGKLVLSLLAAPQGVYATMPRFVVSLSKLNRDVNHEDEEMEEQRSASDGQVIQWAPSKATIHTAPLTWITVHLLEQHLRGLLTPPACPADSDAAVIAAKHEVFLIENVALLCEMMQELQALCTALLLLDGASLDASKHKVLRSAQSTLQEAARFVVRNASQCAEAIHQQQACRLLTALFRLQVVDPSQRSSQSAVCCLLMKLFPILSSNTYAAVTERMQERASGSLFHSLSKAHRTKLRRHHGVTTPNAAAAVLANTISENRVHNRQVSAALRLRKMSDLYRLNLVVLEQHPVGTVALIFQIACMTACGDRVPPPAARMLIGAACLSGEVLLDKLHVDPVTTFQRGPASVANAIERLASLTTGAVAALPVARQHVGLLPQESKNITGEFYFISQLLVHFLRNVAGLAARALQLLDRASQPAQQGKGATSPRLEGMSLRQMSILCEALSDLHTLSIRQTRTQSTTLETQTKETLQLMKALMSAAGTSWWTAELSKASSSDARQSWCEAIRVAMNTYDMMDAPFDELLGRVTVLSPPTMRNLKSSDSA